MEVKNLDDEVATLKTAIEEAIREGQKSTDSLNDISRSGLVFNKYFTLTRTNAGSRAAGWVNDF